ncbi:MAG: hypothetical protein IJ660_05025 [Alphaproteobacteria bacterium]|nr:hypothetical protein [Alphaproteobacteria bacterium]
MLFVKRTWLDIALLIIFVVLGGCLKLIYPTDLLWDLLNYHYYNPWALVHDRLGYDIAPATLNTFFNPLLDLPFYFMIRLWNDIPSLIRFLQGTSYGLLIFVFYKIATLFFDIKKQKLAFFLTILIATTGFSVLSQVGIVSNEIQIAVLILWGFYIILKAIDNDKRAGTVWVFSGLLMGCALGLKPTSISYCVAIGGTLIIFHKLLHISMKEIVIFAICGVLGYLIVNGWWMWKLYSHFDNPFFPFLNKIFKSEYFDAVNYYDIRFLKGPWWHRLIFPFFMTFNYGQYYTAETFYIDFRYLFVYGAVIWGIITWLLDKHVWPPRKFLLLYAFVGLSYLVWLNVFAIIRYAVVVEMLSIIILVHFFETRYPRCYWKQLVFISGMIVGVYVLLSEVFNYMKGWDKVWYGKHYIEIEKIAVPEDALIKIYGFPSALVAARIVDDRPNRIVAYASYNYGTYIDFMDRGKLQEKRDLIEKHHQGTEIILAVREWDFHDELISKVQQKGMYCRLLHFPWDKVDICVPEKLKYQILLEEERYGNKKSAE